MIPLKDGKNNYKEILESNCFGKSTFKLIEAISKHINMGVYEYILNNSVDDVKVISIMGP